MRPIEIAKTMCRQRGINFEAKLIEIIGHPLGVAIIRPDLFALAWPVELTDDEVAGHARDLAWHVTMAVGRLTDLITLFPFPLPFLVFTRWKHDLTRLRIYRMDRFVSLCNRARPGERVRA